MRAWTLVGCALGVLVALVIAASVTAGAAPRLTIHPQRPRALEPVRIELGVPASFRLSALRVRARSPEGELRLVRTTVVKKGARRGTFHFPSPGAWKIIVTDRRGALVPGAPARRVSVRDPAPTPLPEGFGALGKPGCDPPSPASGKMTTFRDIFGTAIGGEMLWALPFLPPGATWPTPHVAVFDGLVGKQVKIVFAMTSFQPPFRAVGPGGATLDPVWGPSFHGSSNWIRQPGAEWGAGFVFPRPGCWRIAVGSRGDLWFLIRS